MVSEDSDRVFLSVDECLRGDGSPVPIGAIVLLRTADGETAMERFSTAHALRDVWALSLKLPSDADRARCFQQVAALVAQVPVWNMYRPMEFASIDRVVEKIVGACSAS